MPIALTHNVKDRIVDVAAFLDGVTTVGALCDRIELLGKQPTGDDCNTYRGDLFELFAEYLINSQHANAFIGVRDYRPLANFDAPPGVTLNGDYGIDGVGRSTMTGKWAAVQVKYRSNAHAEVNYSKDRLGNLISQAVSSGLFEDVTVKEMCQHLLVLTTASGMDWRTTQQAFSNKVRCFGRQELAQFCDGHVMFWADFKQSILDSQVVQKATTVKVLRQHQEEAVTAVLTGIGDGVARGQVILPTGTGKTLIMSRIILDVVRNDVSTPAGVDAGTVTKPTR